MRKLYDAYAKVIRQLCETYMKHMQAYTHLLRDAQEAYRHRIRGVDELARRLHAKCAKLLRSSYDTHAITIIACTKLIRSYTNVVRTIFGAYSANTKPIRSVCESYRNLHEAYYIPARNGHEPGRNLYATCTKRTRNSYVAYTRAMRT